MKEFIVPEDDVVVRTEQGRTILHLSIQAQGNIVRMFGADGVPKIALAAYGDTGTLIIGDPNKKGIVISVSEDMSNINIINSGKSIDLAINQMGSELTFLNANGAITNKLYVDENGGQIGLGDKEGILMMSAGAGEQGGTCHLMNKKGDTVVLLESNEENGNITLVDEDGHIIWTTMSS